MIKRNITSFLVPGKTVVAGLFILICSATICLSQEKFVEDSLLALYNSSDDEDIRITLLLDISTHYDTKDLNKGIAYANRALKEAQKENNYSLTARAYNQLGILYSQMGAYDRAIGNLLLSKSVLEENKDYRNIIGVVLNLGNIHYFMKQYEKALEEYKQAIIFNNKLLEQNDSSFMKHLHLIYNSTGAAYKELGEYKPAIEYLERAFAEAIRLNDFRQLGIIYDNLGLIYLEQKNYNRAREYMMKAFEYFNKYNLKSNLARTYIHLTDFYIAIEQFDSALYANAKAIEYGELLNLPDIMRDAYKMKAHILEQRNDLNSSIEALKKYHVIKDHLLDKSVVEKITRLQMEYEFEKQEEIQKLEHQKILTRIYIITGALVFLLMFFILLYLLLRSRAKRTTLERDSLFKDLELKNKELSTNVMYLIKKNEYMNDISGRLSDLVFELKDANKAPVRKVIHDIQTDADNDTRQEFELRFQQVHTDFFSGLQKRFQSLTPGELKICAFLRLNMTTKDISSITGQTTRSIEVTRSRIRKKMNINNTETNLISCLSEF